MNSPPVTTRTASAEDRDFLFALFKAVRATEFAHLPLPPEQLDHLLRFQYAGQMQSYAAQYPDGDRLILFENVPVGRIWVHRGEHEHTLVDISLMPEYRNRGIGAALVEQAIAEARAAHVPLRCSVAATNAGSLRFHQRLGFRVIAQDQVYYDLLLEP